MHFVKFSLHKKIGNSKNAFVQISLHRKFFGIQNMHFVKNFSLAVFRVRRRTSRAENRPSESVWPRAILITIVSNILRRAFGPGAEHPAPGIAILGPGNTNSRKCEQYYCRPSIPAQNIRRRESPFWAREILIAIVSNTTRKCELLSDHPYTHTRMQVRRRGGGGECRWKRVV